MTHAARTRFLTDFFAALFRLNRDVLHLVLDEADEAAPQSRCRKPAGCSGRSIASSVAAAPGAFG
jgi:hypothetical protein